MRAIEKSYLSSAKASQISEEILNGKSLLLSFGSWKAFFQSLPIKIIAFVVFPFIMRGVSKLPESQRFYVARKRLLNFFLKFMPYEVKIDFPPHYTSPIIAGFNHSSLGDVLRIAAAMIERYPAKALYFPMNLVFYESFSPITKFLESISIFLCPMITPSLYEKLRTSQNEELLRSVKGRLERHYLKEAKLCCQGYGVFVVAPATTRKPTVFDSKSQADGEENTKLLPTMTILLKYLAKLPKVFYMAVSIDPPNFRTGPGLFKTFGIRFSQEFTTKEAIALDAESKRGFEYAFLKALTDQLPYQRWYPR